MLPRITDAVSDALAFSADCLDGEQVDQLIADVSDAFWLVPPNPSERRYFVAKFRGKYLIFTRTAQGSRAAPLTFCAVMSLATRLVQSILLRDHLSRRVRQDARVQVYTDDPWIVARGAKHQIDRCFAIALVMWKVLGLPIATREATRGSKLKWIGMNITVSATEVLVEIPEEKILELEQMSLTLLKSNVKQTSAYICGQGHVRCFNYICLETVYISAL